jgi:hypothetical protein
MQPESDMSILPTETLPNMRVRREGAPLDGGFHAPQAKTPEKPPGRLPALQAAQGQRLLP